MNTSNEQFFRRLEDEAERLLQEAARLRRKGKPGKWFVEEGIEPGWIVKRSDPAIGEYVVLPEKFDSEEAAQARADVLNKSAKLAIVDGPPR